MIEYFSNLMAARRRQEGASAVEYGLMVAAIAAVIVIAVFAVGNLVNGAFTKTQSCLTDAKSAGCTGQTPAPTNP